jgi:hypothetical protein
VQWCKGLSTLGLLGGASPALPALRSLDVSVSRDAALALTECPWLKSLTKLRLECVDVGPGLTAALSGGALQELTLDFGRYNSVYLANLSWSDLDLPHLTGLKVECDRGDALGNVARARMPLLRCAELPINDLTSTAGVRAFSIAFPLLKELKLENDNYSRGPPWSEAVEVLRLEILPRLEVLAWHSGTPDALSLIESLLPPGPANGAPFFPHLRSLILSFSQLYNVSQTESYVALARAAPHFPALTHLQARLGRWIASEAQDAFLATAKASEVPVWPLLSEMCICCYITGRKRFNAKLREVWPRLAVKFFSY